MLPAVSGILPDNVTIAQPQPARIHLHGHEEVAGKMPATAGRMPALPS